MIEALLIAYLRNTLTGINVYTMRPADCVAPFVLIEKTGGGYENAIHSAVIAVQSYGETLNKAAALNEQVKEALLNARNSVENINSVSLNTDYNYTNPSNREYRYQAIFEINFMTDY